ncbi:Pimeloyl-ACP methyl ester carboxylesterase [Rhizobiales bacterium GAS191]|jgi:pimeloyl-ACP methyl ester carboxylesterase|nr:Pimeloyl-ACP methyl ester carboxylesterase [Rhizobiales bacterium GAS191]
MTSNAPTPFTIDIPDVVLDDLRSRLDRTRFADALEGTGWDWGMNAAALQILVRHWRDFDWRAAEAAINEVPAFQARIDGVGLHVVHVRGEGKRRLPIILTNGWPSCYTELLPLIPLLTREREGLSFDVVIPSLPGYGFSKKPTAPGMNITRIADLWAKLMTILGYERFLAHGSDMGAGVVERLRANHAERMIGVHMVNVFSGYPQPDDPSAEERAFLESVPQWRMSEGAYAMLHATKPQTIAAALMDSPAGLAAWIGEKFAGWSDGDTISLDALCTVLTIYWATGTIASSQRLYREAFADAGAMSPPPKSGPPLGVVIFPRDILPAPRAWGERWFETAQWTVMPRGGHFPGFEVPHLLAADIRAFVGKIGGRQ